MIQQSVVKKLLFRKSDPAAENVNTSLWKRHPWWWENNITSMSSLSNSNQSHKIRNSISLQRRVMVNSPPTKYFFCRIIDITEHLVLYILLGRTSQKIFSNCALQCIFTANATCTKWPPLHLCLVIIYKPMPI